MTAVALVSGASTPTDSPSLDDDELVEPLELLLSEEDELDELLLEEDDELPDSLVETDEPSSTLFALICSGTASTTFSELTRGTTVDFASINGFFSRSLIVFGPETSNF